MVPRAFFLLSSRPPKVPSKTTVFVVVLVILRVRFEPAVVPPKALADAVSVRLKAAGRVPVFVIFRLPVRLSPGLTFVRLKMAALALLFDCVSVPVVTALVVLDVVDVKVAPEPTATAAAASRVARGTMALRRLAIMSVSLPVLPSAVGGGCGWFLVLRRTLGGRHPRAGNARSSA